MAIRQEDVPAPILDDRGKGFLLRDDRWAYLQYGEDAAGGIELFDMHADPQQYTNLAVKPDHADTVAQFRTRLAEKLQSIRDNDLGGSEGSAAGTSETTN